MTYYVAKNGGTGSGLDGANAWSLAHLNGVSLAAGDIVLLRRGDVFYGTLTAGSGVAYGAYGTGANPKISGLTTLTGWVLSAGNVYYVPLDQESVNVVLLDGLLQAMGRFPKTGYLTYVAHSGTATLTAAADLPFDPTGAELVIRKIRQVTDRQFVTGISGRTMTLSGAGAYGTNYANNTTWQPSDGMGFFVQGHPNTLTQAGEWYHDKAANRLYMHFGTGTPQGRAVQIGTLAKNIDLDSRSNVRFEHIDFEGANRGVAGNPMNQVADLTFTNCHISKQLNGFVSDNGCAGLMLERCSLTDVLNNGLLTTQSEDVMVDETVFTNIGIIPGAGGSGDAQQLAVWIVGNNSTVRNTRLKNIGYHGIVQYGSNTLAEDNDIDTFGLTKDDCGGIYEFQFLNVVHTNKVIQRNKIRNGVGVPAGAPAYAPYGQAMGIYIDVNAKNVEIYDNDIDTCNWAGIGCLALIEDNEIHYNRVTNCKYQLLLSGINRNLRVHHNDFRAKAGQDCLYVEMLEPDNLALLGTFAQNRYDKAGNDLAVTINRVYGGGESRMRLSAWKKLTGLDLDSISNAKLLRAGGKLLRAGGKLVAATK